MAEGNYFLMLMLCGFFSGIVLIFFRPIWSSLISLLLIFLLLIAGIVALDNYALWLPLIGPILTILFSFAVTTFYQYTFLNKQKRKITKLFSPYLSSMLLNKIAKNPERIILDGNKSLNTGTQYQELPLSSFLFSPFAQAFPKLDSELYGLVLVGFSNSSPVAGLSSSS